MSFPIFIFWKMSCPFIFYFEKCFSATYFCYIKHRMLSEIEGHPYFVEHITNNPWVHQLSDEKSILTLGKTFAIAYTPFHMTHCTIFVWRQMNYWNVSLSVPSQPYVTFIIPTHLRYCFLNCCFASFSQFKY